jgi:hypothetical protein
VNDVAHSDINAKDEGESKNESSGMSGGKKAGIVIGVLLAAGVVAVGAFVFKKRNDNIRRSQYGEAARTRRDIL